MRIARGGRVRASPPSCESITRSRWVGFCYSCASAPSPAGLLGVPWTGKSCRAPRTPLRSPLRSSPLCRARGLLAPADPSNRCDARAFAWPRSAWRARNPGRLRPARKPAGLGRPHPYFAFPLSPSPGVLPVPARFIRRNPVPPSPLRVHARSPDEARTLRAARPLGSFPPAVLQSGPARLVPPAMSFRMPHATPRARA